ncbi:LysR family transcriptional regulator [Rhizobium sp. P44RR-XXIV]|uniref:LysR family transcriptional regulator n=1 Tax=Rhizobium sp. P44RR-XXIV TaxID=1921145 RepID=UPI0009873100|nr:LysR family transcriptional regulator [Rhizobium sp. P44RR-XXIV]TIX92747.1 LysR family transcriptional regulator [Rhizobium sp. P44RR-XXIV]
MDRFSSMSIFVKAVELGSFSAAADALNMSPQLVGKHVQFLEQHLGVRLLNRTTRRQHLTEIGSQFYERSRNILAEVEAAEALAAETRAVPRGKLKVNAPVTFGINALAPKLPKYLGAHPEVSIDLSLSNRLVDLIDEGYDVVFRIGELADSGLIARRLAPYRLVICAAPSYLRSRGVPLKPNDLQGHDCLIFSHTMLRTHWDFEGPGGNVSVPISGRLMVDNGEALLQAALAGQGIILQPFELVRSSLEAGTLLPILPEYSVPTRPLHILHAPDRRITPKLRSFLDFVSAEFGSHGSS